jgi:hypothetical protein
MPTRSYVLGVPDTSFKMIQLQRSATLLENCKAIILDWLNSSLENSKGFVSDNNLKGSCVLGRRILCAVGSSPAGSAMISTGTSIPSMTMLASLEGPHGSLRAKVYGISRMRTVVCGFLPQVLTRPSMDNHDHVGIEQGRFLQ